MLSFVSCESSCKFRAFEILFSLVMEILVGKTVSTCKELELYLTLFNTTLLKTKIIYALFAFSQTSTHDISEYIKKND